MRVSDAPESGTRRPGSIHDRSRYRERGERPNGNLDVRRRGAAHHARLSVTVLRDAGLDEAFGPVGQQMRVHAAALRIRAQAVGCRGQPVQAETSVVRGARHRLPDRPVDRRRGHFDASHRLAVGIDHATIYRERAKERDIDVASTLAVLQHERLARQSLRRLDGSLISEHVGQVGRALEAAGGCDELVPPGSAVNSYRPSAPAMIVESPPRRSATSAPGIG